MQNNKNEVEYWSLREGDFFPETLTTLAKSYRSNNGGYYCFPNKEKALEMLAKAGNLFTSKENAVFASNLVRAFLRTLREELGENNPPSGKYPGNILRLLHPFSRETSRQETPCGAFEQKSPSEQISPRPSDGNLQGDHREIHLTIHLHS